MFICSLFLKVDWQGLLKLNKDASIHIKSDNKALSSKDSSKRIWCDYETAGNQENTQSCSWDQPGDEEGDLLIWMDGWMDGYRGETRLQLQLQDRINFYAFTRKLWKKFNASSSVIHTSLSLTVPADDACANLSSNMHVLLSTVYSLCITGHLLWETAQVVSLVA